MEALPEENNYRDMVNLQEGQKARPTIQELKMGQLLKPQGLLVITLANVVTAITAVSMSAVATNGLIQGGGIYYMISRSLGPEFGGAIGIMFTIANSIAVATYLIGFCNSLLDCLEQYIDNFDGIVGDSTHRNNDIRIIATGVLICILGLVIVGLDWVTRVDIGLLLLLLLAQADVLVGSFMPREDEKKYGFIGYSSELISKNLLGTNFHDYGKPNNDPGFFYWFGVYFPAVTGIVAGANLSGDLKDPAGAIPKGTLLAVGITYVAYFGFGLITGCVYLSEASGIEEEYWAAITGNNATLHFDDCKNPERFLQGKPCKYGSSNDQQAALPPPSHLPSPVLSVAQEFCRLWPKTNSIRYLISLPKAVDQIMIQSEATFWCLSSHLVAQ
ncbi:unnamed protein product [Sphagnum tenellum]